MKTTRTLAVGAMAGAALVLYQGTARAGDLDLELGTTAQYFEYREPGLMEETGMLYGVNGELTYRWESGWVIGARGEVVGGGLDYDGQTWGGTPVTANTEDVILRGDLLVGRYVVNQLAEGFAYTGLGTRYWNQVIDGAGGYEREITWHYVPIGVRLRGAVDEKPGWSWTAALEYRAVVDGTVRSHLSDVDPRFNDPENDVSDGYGGYFSLGVIYRFADVSTFSALAITPYLEVWDVDASSVEVLTFNGEPAALVHEPANETTVYGVEVSLRF